MYEELREALEELKGGHPNPVPHKHVIYRKRGSKIHACNVAHWFRKAYRALGLEGCSSHSGRRTFITQAARKVSLVGGSLRDVQLLAGHKSLSMTQRYIEANTDAQQALVKLL